jgi:stage III sporulation protein AA
MDIKDIFPLHIRKGLEEEDWRDGLEEIRVRVGQPVEFLGDRGSKYLVKKSGVYLIEKQTSESYIYRATKQDVEEMLNYISGYSLYAYQEQMRQGYITIEGGHRIGLAGGVVLEGGKVAGFHSVSFLNVRVAGVHRGCANQMVEHICNQNDIYNTLIFSEPGAGKTTLLRDCIRQLSDGTASMPGKKVCVVDERSEIGACYLGVPQNDLGTRTDVLDGCGKADGMQMLLRSMSPQIMAVDELGGETDFKVVEEALYTGCRILGTLHAGSVEELAHKPYLQHWMKKEIFQRYVWIMRDGKGERKIQIFNERLERLC